MRRTLILILTTLASLFAVSLGQGRPTMMSVT